MKTIIIAFTCDLLIPDFLILCDVRIFKCIHCLFVSARVFPQFHNKFEIDMLLDFHPSRESGKTTQRGHTQSSEANELL
jgi:hypothetical protein